MGRFVKILSVLVVGCVALVVAGVAILKSQDFNEYKDLIAENVRDVTGRDLQISGELDLKISLTPSIVVEGLTLGNAPWASTSEMVSIDKFAAEVSLIPLLSGTIDVNQVILSGVTVSAETDKSGKGNWIFDTQEDVSSSAEKSSSTGNVVVPVVRLANINDIKITFQDGVSGETISLNVDKLSVGTDGPDAPLTLDMNGSLNSQAFEVSGAAGTINTLISGGMIPLNLEVKGLATTVTLEGQAGLAGGEPAADLKFETSIPKISDAVTAIATLVPAIKDDALPSVEVLKISGSTKFSNNTLSVSDLQISIGSSDLSGDVSVDLKQSVPTINGDLSSNLLNIDELLPKSDSVDTAQVTPSPTNDGKVFPADVLQLEGLKSVNATLKFAGKKIKTQGVDITNTSLAVSLQNGKLDVSPGATVFGGKVSGGVVLDGSATTPSLKTSLKVSQLDYGEALTSQGLNDIANGKVDINVAVSGRGNSVRALMASLNGQTRIVTENGRLESGALNIVSTDLMNVLDSKDDKTIKCGVVHFDIKSGIADARSIVVETGGFSVIGTGGIDLKTEQPKLRIDPRAKKANLASVAMIPVDIHGTLAKPDYTIDAAAAAGNVASGVARSGAAIATLGLSLLVEKAVSEGAGMAVDQNDYCALALAGKKVVPGKTEPQAASEKAGSNMPAKKTEQKKEEGALDSIGEGIGSGLKSLFGTTNN
jgi:uncharacterized protein involved in outer membrane biogenesis